MMMKSKKVAAPQSRTHADLQSMYREIGISAVAAALRYQGEARNPAYAPAASAHTDERLHEAV
jgi:hypothetical protein